ncbi:MAG: hypothetical protein A4E40_01265 [Methanoregulaceae archaeon PtaU1.Bin059]|nr:MAG: hypothetical protein A4E40_01265 [Methanoregulaceae archaeon PtaU1.Bin059]
MISLVFSTSIRYFLSLSSRAFSAFLTVVMSVRMFMIAGDPDTLMTVPRTLTVRGFLSRLMRLMIYGLSIPDSRRKRAASCTAAWNSGAMNFRIGWPTTSSGCHPMDSVIAGLT